MQIDRVMDSFSAHYCAQNPDIFEERDTCFILSFSIIMLNTALHNPNAKIKISSEQFVKQNKGINSGKDLPVDMLEAIYRNIKEEPFKIPDETYDDLMYTFFSPEREGWLEKQVSTFANTLMFILTKRPGRFAVLNPATFQCNCQLLDIIRQFSKLTEYSIETNRFLFRAAAGRAGRDVGSSSTTNVSTTSNTLPRPAPRASFPSRASRSVPSPTRAAKTGSLRSSATPAARWSRAARQIPTEPWYRATISITGEESFILASLSSAIRN